MYNYHNTLRAAHPASSPFWAWPLDFKPVWFYQGSFANNTSAAIYDNGNLITWWLEIPAIAFVAWQAFKRGSLALGLITIGFVLQWVPWMRIDRATFQYHYYTSLPFMVLALAYFLAELWHGASRRTWLLARVSTALVVLGPGLLWLFKDPLCAVVGVDRANPGSGACVNSTPGDLLVTVQAAGIAIVMGVAGLVLVFLLLRLRDGATDRQLARVVAVAVAAVAGVVLARLFLPTTPLIDQAGFSTEPIAVAIVLVLSPVAYVALTARDARRLVGSILAGGTLFFVVFYPNIAALPLPSTIFNFYQGIIPTWLYPFQFPDNTDVAVAGSPLFSLVPILTGLMLTVLCVVVGYSAWTARIPRLAAGPARQPRRTIRAMDRPADRAMRDRLARAPRCRPDPPASEDPNDRSVGRDPGRPRGRGRAGRPGPEGSRHESPGAGARPRPPGGSRSRSRPRPWRSPAPS